MKKIAALLVLICLCLTFAACQGDEPEGEAALPALSFGILPDTQSVPVALAANLGYFEEEGVNVTVERFTSAAERDSALQSGNLDGQIADLVAVMLFRQGGFDISAVALSEGSQQLLAAPGSEAATVADLQGSTVALSENTVMEYATDRLLEAAGLDPDTAVTKTYIPQMTVRMEMLQAGKVAAATMPEPQVSVAKASGATVLAGSDELDMHSTVIAFRDDSIAEKEEAIAAFFRAYDRAVEYLNSNEPSTYMATVITETGFPETVADTIELPAYLPARAPFDADVVSVSDWMLAKGLMSEAMTYDTVVDDRFVR